MFNAIARRYELVNSVFSAGRDRHWRRRAVELARVQPDDRVLDLACGTGNFARAFAAKRPALVVGSDFAHDMLNLANRPSYHAIHWCEADALRIPFADQSFSIVSCAFGVRNWNDLDEGIRETRRVLKPGGRFVILEFSQPRARLFRRLYEFYSHRLMPWGATLLSGDRTGAYRYLPQSVSTFVDTAQMKEQLRRGGLNPVLAKPLTLGVVTVHLAIRETE